MQDFERPPFIELEAPASLLLGLCNSVRLLSCWGEMEEIFTPLPHPKYVLFSLLARPDIGRGFGTVYENEIPLCCLN